MSTSKAGEIVSLPYIDIQHDAQAVFDDVEQGTVLREDIWISAYKAGSSSVHGKARVEFEEGGGSRLTAGDGVRVTRQSKGNYLVSFPALGLADVPVRFPKQVFHPPYTKKSPLDPPLHINALSHSPKGSQVVVGGPDGYCAVLDVGQASKAEPVMLKGHVGDVLDVRWFPSGEVVLSCSSDLSIRIFRSADGLNPRTLTGHTRAVTTALPVGVGKEVLSGSKDGTVRLWNVGEGKEVKRWETVGRAPVEGVVLVEDEGGRRALGLGLENEERGVVVVTTEGWAEVWGWSDPASSKARARVRLRQGGTGGVGAVAYDETTQVLAVGWTDGVVLLRHLSTVTAATGTASADQTQNGSPAEEGRIKLVRRNESPIYSLAFAPSLTTTPAKPDGSDLLVGTAAGLPCRLGMEVEDGRIGRVWVKEEYAGWEPVAIECWSVEPGGKGVWCGGGEGGLRRY